MCEESKNSNILLVCDKCVEKVCHIYCLDPPLQFIPEIEWFCDFCVKNEEIKPTLPIGKYFENKLKINFKKTDKKVNVFDQFK